MWLWLGQVWRHVCSQQLCSIEDVVGESTWVWSNNREIKEDEKSSVDMRHIKQEMRRAHLVAMNGNWSRGSGPTLGLRVVISKPLSRKPRAIGRFSKGSVGTDILRGLSSQLLCFLMDTSPKSSVWRERAPQQSGEFNTLSSFSLLPFPTVLNSYPSWILW